MFFVAIGDGFLHQKTSESSPKISESRFVYGIFMAFPMVFPIGFPHAEHVGCRWLSWRHPQRHPTCAFRQRRPGPRHQRSAQRPVAMAPDKSW